MTPTSNASPFRPKQHAQESWKQIVLDNGMLEKAPDIDPRLKFGDYMSCRIRRIIVDLAQQSPSATFSHEEQPMRVAKMKKLADLVKEMEERGLFQAQLREQNIESLRVHYGRFKNRILVANEKAGHERNDAMSPYCLEEQREAHFSEDRADQSWLGQVKRKRAQGFEDRAAESRPTQTEPAPSCRPQHREGFATRPESTASNPVRGLKRKASHERMSSTDMHDQARRASIVTSSRMRSLSIGPIDTSPPTTFPPLILAELLPPLSEGLYPTWIVVQPSLDDTRATSPCVRTAHLLTDGNLTDNSYRKLTSKIVPSITGGFRLDPATQLLTVRSAEATWKILDESRSALEEAFEQVMDGSDLVVKVVKR